MIIFLSNLICGKKNNAVVTPEVCIGHKDDVNPTSKVDQQSSDDVKPLSESHVVLKPQINPPKLEIDPQYNEKSIKYCLALISNAASFQEDCTQRQLQDYARKIITEMFNDIDVEKLIGSWNLAWGPQVYQHAPGTKIADNTMYVAQNRENPNEFVIAIAGTNPSSTFDWLVEDFKLKDPETGSLVPWDEVVGNKSTQPTGNIAYGSRKGLEALMEMKDSSSQMSIKDFLKNSSNSFREPLKITVCGHSLGGALSPLLALELMESQADWDRTQSSHINVQAMAGPTPGDKVWRDYYDERLGKSTNRIWNSLDIVPHAWDEDTMHEINTIYYPHIKLDPRDALLLKIALGRSKGLEMKQICPDTKPFPGLFDADFEDFKDQVVYQHIGAYNEWFQVQEYVKIYNSIIGSTSYN